MRGQKLKLQAIQKEQCQLVKIEQILQNLLGKVNESVNELKVEELQLKSSLIEVLTSNDDDRPTTSAQAVIRSQANIFDTTTTTTLNSEEPDGKMSLEGIETINKQMLTLESLLVPLQQSKFIYEEEEDDEDE